MYFDVNVLFVKCILLQKSYRYGTSHKWGKRVNIVLYFNVLKLRKSFADTNYVANCYKDSWMIYIIWFAITFEIMMPNATTFCTIINMHLEMCKNYGSFLSF